MRNFHLIGIGGSGLSAIARVLLERGEQVSGSDRQPSAVTQALEVDGATVYIGHQAQNVAGADLVIRSSAVTEENVEVQSARLAGIPVLKRSEFMPDFLAGYQVIAVAGTHGKTTTTAMIAWLLTRLSLDPSYIIGGVSSNLGTNAHSGAGSYFVIEADEYDNMFHGLKPGLAVVTNIEYDHPDFFTTQQEYDGAFRIFVDRLAPDGVLVACMDNPGSRRLALERIGDGSKVIGYGLTGSKPGDAYQVDYYTSEISATSGFGSSFDIYKSGEILAHVDLPLPGEQNVQNALAAFVVCDLLELSLPEAAGAINEFRGTGRRFEIRGQAQGVTVIDDYAHHPTEIKTTLAAARSYFPHQEIWAVWQPHTYSRTRMFRSEYLSAFEAADHVVVTAIYAARETLPANGFSSQDIAAEMQHADARYSPDINTAVELLIATLKENSVLVVLSAGDADQISTQVLRGLV